MDGFLDVDFECENLVKRKPHIHTEIEATTIESSATAFQQGIWNTLHSRLCPIKNLILAQSSVYSNP